jgi:hypothetical protein
MIAEIEDVATRRNLGHAPLCNSAHPLAGRSPMLQIIYASAASKPFTHRELVALLKIVREKNSAASISGMLLYHEGSFLQVLEGPDKDVDALYSKIQLDPRHGSFMLLLREPVQGREFENWSMGFVDTTHAADNVEGFVDYVHQLKTMTLDPTLAHRTLKRFQEGTWRLKANS